jgi:hypothetical protein
MSTQEIPAQADFRERAKTNDVPIARLIGFEAKDIADGQATVGRRRPLAVEAKLSLQSARGLGIR